MAHCFDAIYKKNSANSSGTKSRGRQAPAGKHYNTVLKVHFHILLDSRLVTLVRPSFHRHRSHHARLFHSFTRRRLRVVSWDRCVTESYTIYARVHGCFNPEWPPTTAGLHRAVGSKSELKTFLKILHVQLHSQITWFFSHVSCSSISFFAD